MLQRGRCEAVGVAKEEIGVIWKGRAACCEVAGSGVGEDIGLGTIGLRGDSASCVLSSGRGLWPVGESWSSDSELGLLLRAAGELCLLLRAAGVAGLGVRERRPVGGGRRGVAKGEGIGEGGEVGVIWKGKGP